MLPVLYSFRRCPYAMRARLAIAASGLSVELREVVLREKPVEMLTASPKGTVPVLVLPDGGIVDESLDIMLWALGQSDPGGWLDYSREARSEFDTLVSNFDGPFKNALDRYKYSSRHAGRDREEERERAAGHLHELNARLETRPYLMGERFSIADAAILPFVRQYAFTDLEWFRAQYWPNVADWLDAFLASTRFALVMEKYRPWQSGQAGVSFP